ncbi:ABC transporter ATP-binding protein [Flavobacterium davisii]|uniref:ABC transporter ATP-binding protein n=1 Tax=Flavobacterium davisii TaxID=2906077 RepID=A0A2D0AIZ7_9FLAO|nr:ABC transporter ATP-binding protein [Flavobacterium davisii]OWP85210.1 ABC transporter ATP-binding protein [Flavobacterium davisii]
MGSHNVILKIENLSKQYRLGTVGTGTISHDLNRWWYKIRGKEDPYLKVGETNDRKSKGTSDYVWALKDINFEVQKGEVLGIIGKNGAGKSTLLKILSKVTAPSTGVIKSRGRIASLLEVGTGFNPELTGRENIYLNGAILGMTKAEITSKLDEIIAFSGCERYIDTPTKRYSSGMTVRLAFAVAAFLEPEILVVDEVLAVGDAEFQQKAIGKMQDIAQGQGRTVLFVSHDMSAISTLTKRCLLLQNGKIILDDSTNKVIEKYLHDYKNFSSKIEIVFFDKFKVNNVSLMNLKDEKIDLIEYNTDFKLNLNLTKISKEEEEFCVEFKLKNSKELLITIFSTYLSDFNISTQNNIELECLVEKINLALGHYYIDLYFISKTTEEVVIFENVLSFEVISGVNYLIKKQFKTQYHGHVVLSYNWLQR